MQSTFWGSPAPGAGSPMPRAPGPMMPRRMRSLAPSTLDAAKVPASPVATLLMKLRLDCMERYSFVVVEDNPDYSRRGSVVRWRQPMPKDYKWREIEDLPEDAGSLTNDELRGSLRFRPRRYCHLDRTRDHQRSCITTRPIPEAWASGAASATCSGAIVARVSCVMLPHQLDAKKGTCRAIIETPKGCRNKFDYDPESDLFMLGGFSALVMDPQPAARVCAAFCAARLRPTEPFVRTDFAAALRKLCLPRVRALLHACRESDSLDAADRPSRLRTPPIARERFAEGLRFVAFVVFPLGLGPNFTPARRAFDKPIAIACLVLRAPCLPSRIWRISSRTNSPACVVEAFPARASSRARLMVVFSGINRSSLFSAHVIGHSGSSNSARM